MNALVVVRTATEPELLHAAVGGPDGEYRPQLSAVLRSADGLGLVAEIDHDIVGRVTVDMTYVGEGYTAGLRSRDVAIHAPEPVWKMAKSIA